jgi:hypothetical protein
MADFVIDNPLRSAEQVKDFVRPMYKNIPYLRAAMREHATDLGRIVALCEKMIQLRDNLFSSMCDNYVEMSKREALALNHPGSSAIILFIYCATLTVMSKVEIDSLSEERMNVVRKHGLCLYPRSNPRCSPNEHTAQDILNVIWLVSNRWPLLRLTDRGEIEAVFKYLQQMVHRAFIIIAEPHPRSVLDCKHVTEATGPTGPGGVEKLYKANLDLIRRFTDGLCRMLGCIRAFFVLEWKPPSFPPHLREDELMAALSAKIQSNIKELMKLPSLRQEVRMMFDRLSTRHCDFAVFVEKCNNEPYDPTAMMMMTKPPEYQTSSIQYNNCVDYAELARTTDEGAPDYEKVTDIFTHLHAQNIKFHAIEMNLREYDIKLRADYVLSEVDFLVHIFNTTKESFPSFISFMGRYHVIMGGEVYICEKGIEQAICVWARIILYNLKGQLGGINVVAGLAKIFSNKHALIHGLSSDTPPPSSGDPAAAPAALFTGPPTWGDDGFI